MAVKRILTEMEKALIALVFDFEYPAHPFEWPNTANDTQQRTVVIYGTIGYKPLIKRGKEIFLL